MKNAQNILFIFITTLFLQSCIANSPANNRKSLSSKSTTTTTTPVTPVFASDETLYWFTSAKVTGTITINFDSTSVVYLRGLNIHNFLTSVDVNKVPNYQRQFCIVGNYGTSYRQLRVRAVPIYITNFTTKAIERLLRVDFPSTDENLGACGTTIIDGINGTTTVPERTVAYSVKDICFTGTGCLGASQITSSTLKFYEASSMSQVSTSQISLASVGVKLDILSNSTSPGSSCSNSACEAKGFDCCSEGQCVKDATIKASVDKNSQAYLQAMSEYAVNPLNFINFPNIFNICSNIAHTPPPIVTTPGTTPLTAAQERVKAYLADYKCLSQVESGGSYSLCLPGLTITDYNTTKKKLAVACGCPATYSDNEVIAKCPNWGVRPLYNSTIEIVSNIVDFYCYTPTPVDPNGPITNLNVNVPSRSAPHRFYDTAGNNYDDPSKQATSVIQEGDDFYYLDSANKASPVNNKYNMNSILGRMNVGLSQTQPAKTVAVELGKTYILSATSGYFTPCSQCAKDSWFQNFTAHPATTLGLGLRAAGFSTSRDTYAGNTTFGNYEDTQFGRACYLPATMIPFSHMKNANLQTQRLNRLKTQAAYYINGYQKDWYGFNKGALIGSFDGVSWFAIGTGRRVAATSSKLFLAINGAFLDLADRTDTVVNIIPDVSANTVADYDYDPTLAITDLKQNAAGSCQQYHQCSTDTECVTQLGWEYTCAEVGQMRTSWPIYDAAAKETANQEKYGTIFDILQGTTTTGSSTKRCVYRGAGAPCVRNYTTLNGKVNQKALTCAPNFYCADLNTNRFNEELVRSPNEFDNILYGMDTNVLGRPLKYVTATKNLTSDIIANIKNNGSAAALNLSSTEVDDMGICRPGRSLSSVAATAHSNPDPSRRTDYISQVGSCDSTALGDARSVSCPAFGDDGDYVPYNSTTYSPSLYKKTQNSCGGESKNTTGTFLSAFSNIEGGSLQILSNISQPTLAADACFRRAGSVCHTDLDCSPNKMHEEASSSLSLSYFGGTEAEQNYWKESMVCGQGAATPALGTPSYTTYKLSENRCCREVGKDFTMFTSGPASIIPENMGTNVNLNTRQLASIDPTAANRYSRYAVSKIGVADTTTIPAVNTNTTPTKNQWKVVNETGALTCCGGGWVRKFADGTHDWKIKNRLSLDTSNFACLNYRSPLVSGNYSNFAADNIVQETYQREYENLCRWPNYNGCMQILYRDIVGESTILPPVVYNPSEATSVGSDDTATVPAWATSSPYSAINYYTKLPAAGSNLTRLETSPIGDITGAYTHKLNRDVPYQPFAYYFTQYPYDLYTDPTTGLKQSFTWFIDKTTDYGVSMYLPAYIPVSISGTNYNPINVNVYIKYFYSNGKQEVVNITNRQTTSAACNAVINYPNTGIGQPIDALAAGDYESWCVSGNSTTQYRPVMNVKAYTGAGRAWSYAGIIIEFVPLEKQKGLTVTTPASPAYYLSKLGRLELIGIPQITYEPIYCNSNQDTLVPGIFTTTPTNPLQTRTDFNLPANSFAGYDSIASYDEDGTNVSDTTPGIGNFGNRMTYQNKLSHAAVFSSKDFACCTPLGKETASAAKCCSGAATTANGKMTCKLPSTTDLSVYFNKFVSNEGVGTNEPLGGLTVAGTDDEVDFNEYTGEPKMRNTTSQKIIELGKKYCQSGVVTNGGAFGEFFPEPYAGYATYDNSTDTVKPISIVDSVMDKTQDNYGFDTGYRWNHHYYCK